MKRALQRLLPDEEVEGALGGACSESYAHDVHIYIEYDFDPRPLTEVQRHSIETTLSTIYKRHFPHLGAKVFIR